MQPNCFATKLNFFSMLGVKNYSISYLLCTLLCAILSTHF